MPCRSCGNSKKPSPDPNILSRKAAIEERNKRQGYTKQTITIVGKKPVTQAQTRAKNKSLLIG